MYEETQMEKTFRKLKRLEEMLHDRMFIPVDQVEMSVWTTKKPVHEVPDRALFSPCEKGRKWLEEGLYCWFLGGLYHTGKAGRTDTFYLSEDQGL